MDGMAAMVIVRRRSTRRSVETASRRRRVAIWAREGICDRFVRGVGRGLELAVVAGRAAKDDRMEVAALAEGADLPPVEEACQRLGEVARGDALVPDAALRDLDHASDTARAPIVAVLRQARRAGEDRLDLAGRSWERIRVRGWETSASTLELRPSIASRSNRTEGFGSSAAAHLETRTGGREIGAVDHQVGRRRVRIRRIDRADETWRARADIGRGARDLGGHRPAKPVRQARERAERRQEAPGQH